MKWITHLMIKLWKYMPTERPPRMYVTFLFFSKTIDDVAVPVVTGFQLLKIVYKKK